MAELTPDLGLTLALCGVFHPLEIPELAQNPTMLAEAARLSVEQPYEDQWLWTLRPEARLLFLGHLPPPGLLRRRRLAAQVPRKGDWLAHAMQCLLAARPDSALRGILAGRPSPDVPADALLALFQTMQLLLQAQVQLPAWSARPQVLDRLKEAVEQGRQYHEQQALLANAACAPADELLQKMQDFALAPAASGTLNLLWVADSRRPDLTVPLGLLHRQLLAQPRGQTLCILLDLQRSALRGGAPRAITHEMLRQLAQQQPAIAGPLAAIRTQLRATETPDDAATADALTAVQPLLKSLPTRTLVLLVHAWENATAQGHEGDMAAWLLKAKQIFCAADVARSVRAVVTVQAAHQAVGWNWPWDETQVHVECWGDGPSP